MAHRKCNPAIHLSSCSISAIKLQIGPVGSYQLLLSFRRFRIFDGSEFTVLFHTRQIDGVRNRAHIARGHHLGARLRRPCLSARRPSGGIVEFAARGGNRAPGSRTGDGRGARVGRAPGRAIGGAPGRRSTCRGRLLSDAAGAIFACARFPDATCHVQPLLTCSCRFLQRGLPGRRSRGCSLIFARAI